MATKEIRMLTLGMPTSDGAGVKLTRLIGSPELNLLDPFLMLDRFETENPDDYIAGFPPHPHRGFETVTYMLEGTMRHEDNLGNNGLLKPGGIQWMTAGRGIIHSEMPEQVDGAMRGFQLWLNLPSHAKMQDPHYQDYDPDQLPVEKRDNGTEIRVISGETDQGTKGPIVNDWVKPTYFDISLPANTAFEQTLPDGDNSFIFMISGHLLVGEKQRQAKANSLAVLTQGDNVTLKTDEEPARFLLVSGQPLNEPIARGGPFVMNTQEEIRQAFSDFRQGRF